MMKLVCNLKATSAVKCKGKVRGALSPHGVLHLGCAVHAHRHHSYRRLSLQETLEELAVMALRRAEEKPLPADARTALPWRETDVWSTNDKGELP